MSDVRVQFLEAGFTKHLEAVSLRGGKLKTIRFPATVAIIEHPKAGVVLFDTGYSTRFFEQTKYFPNRFYSLVTPVTITPELSALAQLKERGIAVSDVRTVVLSHFHADHIGGVGDFTHAEYVYRKSAFDAVRKLGRWGSVKAGFLQGLLPEDFSRRAQPLVDSDFAQHSFCQDFASGHDLFGDGTVVAVDLPGHAVGQIGLLIEARNNERYFLVADACWGKEAYQELRPPSSVAKLLFSNWGEYNQTLAKLNQAWRGSPDLKIVPCHCDQTISEIHSHATH